VSLEHLWAGWRYQYVTEASKAERSGDDGDGADGCVFCRLAASGPPSPDTGVVWRGELTFAVLNAYPYASGHLLVMPLRHVAELEQLTEDESNELWRTTRQAVVAITAAYDPDAINMGANLGRAAGAGIPGHLHLHVVPRWAGDTNFMTSVAGTRVLSEWLTDAWQRLNPAWPKS
jgi:diadenosine tetraphosphate (Ap4A) HIT family hydrolase